MSSEILERLRVKKSPVVNIKVGIVIPMKPVDIRTKITDKRSQGIIDRGDFMKSIKTKISYAPVVAPTRPHAAPTSASKATPREPQPTTPRLAKPQVELTMKILGKREKKIKLEPRK